MTSNTGNENQTPQEGPEITSCLNCGRIIPKWNGPFQNRWCSPGCQVEHMFNLHKKAKKNGMFHGTN